MIENLNEKGKPKTSIYQLNKSNKFIKTNLKGKIKRNTSTELLIIRPFSFFLYYHLNYLSQFINLFLTIFWSYLIKKLFQLFLLKSYSDIF
jgi:hypothetical protein